MTYLVADTDTAFTTFDIIGNASELTLVDITKFIKNQLKCDLATALNAARLLKTCKSITIAND